MDLKRPNVAQGSTPVRYQVHQFLTQSGSRSGYKHTFALAPDVFLDLNIQSRTKIQLNAPIQNYSSLRLAMNFRSGSDVSFRIDNSKTRFMHYHLYSGSLTLRNHEAIRIPAHSSILGIVDFALQTGSSVLSWRYPGVNIL